MAVVDILKEVEDSRKGSNITKFNGFLEDFLSVTENEELKAQLQPIYEAFPDLRIATEFRFNVNKKTISNQIIRYKDVFKLPYNYFDVSMILYGAIEDREFGIVVADGTRKIDYFLSKGMYYLLTEQYAIFEDCRNEILVLTHAHFGEITEIVESLRNPNLRIGSVQRRLDRQYFHGFYDLHAYLMEFAQAIHDSAPQDMGLVRDRSVVIFRNIATWFLFKKLIYVQYMSNRDLLRDESEGDSRQHRTRAKELVDQVPYIPFSEMWRMKAVDPNEVVSEPVEETVEEVEAVEETVAAEEAVVEATVVDEPEVIADEEQAQEELVEEGLEEPTEE